MAEGGPNAAAVDLLAEIADHHHAHVDGNEREHREACVEQHLMLAVGDPGARNDGARHQQRGGKESERAGDGRKERECNPAHDRRAHLEAHRVARRAEKRIRQRRLQELRMHLHARHGGRDGRRLHVQEADGGSAEKR